MVNYFKKCWFLTLNSSLLLRHSGLPYCIKMMWPQGPHLYAKMECRTAFKSTNLPTYIKMTPKKKKPEEMIATQ